MKLKMDQVAEAGLHGWKGKAARRAAEPVAKRTPASVEQLKLLFGALAFLASLRYVVKTAVALAQSRKG